MKILIIYLLNSYMMRTPTSLEADCVDVMRGLSLNVHGWKRLRKNLAIQTLLSTGNYHIFCLGTF